jgi:hypothetical protein
VNNRSTNAVLILAHDESLLSPQLAKMLNDSTPRNYDVFVVINSEGVSAGRRIFAPNSQIFLDETVKARQKTIIPGNADLVLLNAYSQLEEYSSYLVIEYDVYYNGSLQILINHIFERYVGADFVAPFIRDYKGNEAWMWWPSLVSAGEEVPLNERAYSFLQFALYSRQALKTLKEAVIKGWSGHHEVLHATLFRHRGLKIEALRQSDVLQFDVNTFRAIPPRIIGPKNSLHHPVKRLSEDDLSHQCELSKTIANLKERQDTARIIVKDVLEVTSAQSILDVGCGLGIWLSVAKSLGVKTIKGIDGPWLDGLPLQIAHDDIILHDLRVPLELKQFFDVCFCLEVAHQLEEVYADSLIKLLVSASNFIVFSAAIPFQGGFQNFNGQWPSYWMEKFRAHGYMLFDILRPQHWANESVFWWVRQNTLIFVRKNVAERYISLDKKPAPPKILDVVHPEFFVQRVR